MKLLNRQRLNAFDENDLDFLLELDRAGLFPAPGENAKDFRSRLLELLRENEQLTAKLDTKKTVVLLSDVKVRSSARIPQEIMSEATDTTEQLYQFSIDYIPGFFLNEEIGLLWGGCSVVEEGTLLPIIFIRKSFQNKKKWFLYQRRELIAHELCHAARAPLASTRLEEFFAYQTSDSVLRRYLGNCFIGRFDALYFLLPSLLVLAVQIANVFLEMLLPVWPFWLLTLFGFGALFLRNQLARNCYFRALRNVRQAGAVHAEALLFRLTDQEIRELADLPKTDEIKEYTSIHADRELRWKILEKAFFNPMSIKKEAPHA